MSMDNTRTITDVLVIGAGPAGLMAALALSHVGVTVKVLDRRIAGETSGQADGIQPRMVEIWDTLGIGSELRELGTHVYRTVVYEPNVKGSGIKQASQGLNMPVASARYPYEILAPSHITEGILLRSLSAQGILVEHPVVPHCLRIVEGEGNTGESHVEVTVAKLKEEFLRVNDVQQADRGQLFSTVEAVEEQYVIRAKYVLGCDGGHSWVRKAVNIKLEGENTDLVWGVVDFTPDTNFPTVRAKNIIASPLSGAVGLIPRPHNTARVYVLLGTDSGLPQNEGHSSFASQDSQEKIIQSVQKAFLPYSMRLTNITWCNEYRVGQRVAAKFSAADRVFLLGDASRTHSPKGGQGANAAMMDAYNIAWKLAYVLRGWANADILDTYEMERRSHALELIQFDKDVFQLFKPAQFGAESYIDLWEYRNRFLSGIGLKCESRLTVSDTDHVAPGLHVGERIPPADITRYSDWLPCNLLDLTIYNGHFKLVLLPGDTQDSTIAQRFNDFSKELLEDLHGDVTQFLDIFTVLNIPKEASCENLRLAPALRMIDRLYVDESGLGQVHQRSRLYDSLKIRSEEGAAIIVRPDGHTAMVSGIRAGDVVRIKKYFTTL